MKKIGIIPARLESSRFPKKLLHKVHGKPLIQITYENACRCKDLDEILIATDSKEIASYAKSFHAPVVFTGPCNDGTKRITEAVRDLDRIEDTDVIINLQGDHPCISPLTISSILHPFFDANVLVTTAAICIKDKEKIQSPHIVKCALDLNGNALYFSRSMIPFSSSDYYQHLGIYAYRKKFLLKLSTFEDTPLQTNERLEQLKILEHGYDIKVIIVNDVDISIDVLDDVKNFENYLCAQNISS